MPSRNQGQMDRDSYLEVPCTDGAPPAFLSWIAKSNISPILLIEELPVS